MTIYLPWWFEYVIAAVVLAPLMATLGLLAGALDAVVRSRRDRRRWRACLSAELAWHRQQRSTERAVWEVAVHVWWTMSSARWRATTDMSRPIPILKGERIAEERVDRSKARLNALDARIAEIEQEMNA